ncbi:phosphatase PAP2 family protein [Kribbella sp. NPDC049174]|uniref:phosphatase PAP2 family protein n=1 Tax=Kribbella sp. NPDC049174 TaxID=3364112 RepID=UPI003720C06D
MTGSPPPGPVEERLADRLVDQPGAGAARQRASSLLRRLGGYDRVVYRSVAELSTPRLDEPLRRVSDFANFSKPWFLTAGALAVFGGPRGRRAALTGLTAIGVTSLVVNQPMKKSMGERRRPDRHRLGVPAQRWVRMPASGSFPSGHSASAAAFAVAVGEVIPGFGPVLRVAASVVAFSRVYTGVHYPSDVLVGATVGALFGRVAGRLALRRWPAATRSSQRHDKEHTS